MSLHVGVIGSGGWSRVHLAALAASPHVGRISLAGRNPQSLAARISEFPQVARSETDFRQLLDDPSVDAVTIVVPHRWHADIAATALAAGKHVICEKPAGRTVAEFDRIAAAAERYGRQFLVVMNQLYNPLPLKVRELLESGVIGRPFLSVENSYANHAADYRRPEAWRTSVEGAGGGVLIDGGYHMVYRHLFQLAPWGPPVWVTGDTAQLAIDPAGGCVAEKGEDFVAITVGYTSNLRLEWSHAWSLAAEPLRRRQSFIAGTEGTLEFTDERTGPAVLHRPGESRPLDVPVGPWTGIETTHACLLDLCACLAEGREPAHATLTLARETLEVICGAYAASREGMRQLLSART